MRNETPVCPVCSTELIHGKKMLYETLCEHVLDPNGCNPRPMRGTWVCANEDCLLYQMGYWSDTEGAWYDYGWTVDDIVFFHIPDIFPYNEDMDGIKEKWQKFLCWLGFHDYSKSYGSATEVMYAITGDSERVELGYYSTCKYCGYLDVRWKTDESITCY